MQYEVSFGTYMAHKPITFEISSFYSSENLGKYFSLQVAPQGVYLPFRYYGTTFKASVCVSCIS